MKYKVYALGTGIDDLLLYIPMVRAHITGK